MHTHPHKCTQAPHTHSVRHQFWKKEITLLMRFRVRSVCRLSMSGSSLGTRVVSVLESSRSCASHFPLSLSFLFLIIASHSSMLESQLSTALCTPALYLFMNHDLNTRLKIAKRARTGPRRSDPTPALDSLCGVREMAVHRGMLDTSVRVADRRPHPAPDSGDRSFPD